MECFEQWGIQQIARSMSYDPGSGYLWMCYPQVGSEGVERYPIVAAYQIVAGRREDLNGDGAVDGLDIAILFSAWGTTSGQADVNLDRIVDGADIGRLFSAWTGDVRAASLPEPTAIRLFGIGIFLCVAGRKTKQPRS
ncbi:MAG: hypothetical protein O2931_15415 [Planctomycetota bacterium]|nr:hypothetical protein [Planctomycetota bacterium]MDA1180171.1 hypothetical protein [Planctomycetota bacterium]